MLLLIKGRGVGCYYKLKAAYQDCIHYKEAAKELQ